MTLKIYVARDSKNREWPPNTPHEAEACEWMLQKAWMGFHHLEEMFAIVVNLKDPSAVEQTIEYDPETGQYIISEKIGDAYFRPPTYMTFDEYLENADVNAHSVSCSCEKCEIPSPVRIATLKAAAPSGAIHPIAPQ